MTIGTLMFYGGICGIILCTTSLIIHLLLKKKSQNKLLRKIMEE